ncbi:phage tail protein [Vibrio parahaemolyticus]|uniref:phage tail-collar fiber domain-containing protein n=1 Tax=Vibrio alginolyticus TaxID=663 RepID=UPI0035C6FDAE|nr:phage tail protein [Vibrio parahaemolyticus]
MTQTYITNAGRKALDDAVAAGRNVQVVSVIVDSQMLSNDIDPRTLTKVQHNPTDQNGANAIYPVKGNSANGEVLIAWSLPANSGGYEVNGLGFLLADGTLFAYQRRALGYKPTPSDDAFFEPRGTVKYKGSDAASVEVTLSLDGHFATIPDVNYLINEHENAFRQIMRRIEGNLGQIRIYTKESEVDPEFLPIIGQTIRKSDYPDYFKHLGVTASTLRLPDWSNRYVRQLSDQYQSGVFLEDLIKAHSHTATIADDGSFTPTAYPIDLGIKSTKLTLNGRFYTNTTGEHTHSNSVSSEGEHEHQIHIEDAGAHSHSGKTNTAGNHGHRATISEAGEHNHQTEVWGAGSHWHDIPYEPDGTGGYGSISTGPHQPLINPSKKFHTEAAGYHTHTVRVLRGGLHAHGISLDSSGNHSHSLTIYNNGDHSHTAKASKAPAHSHKVTSSHEGNHRHYVDVNFGDKAVSMKLGQYTVKLHKVAAHSHRATIHSTGGTETRPKSVVAVHAVKVKYVVPL